MSTTAQIIRAAQEAIEFHQPVALDPVEQARNYFDTAWHEADRWRATGELPHSVRGLELLAIDIKLEEEI